MRIKWRTGVLGALMAASLMLTNGSLPAADAPVVHVSAAVTSAGVRVQAEADGPFEYTTYRPSATLYVVDLSGVAAGDSSGARIVASDLVKGYRVISYSSGAKPVVRMEILLAQGVEPKVERTEQQRPHARGFEDCECRASGGRSGHASRGGEDSGTEFHRRSYPLGVLGAKWQSDGSHHLWIWIFGVPFRAASESRPAGS